MGIFKPAWKSNDSGKAVDAVAKITDQAVLKEIVNSDVYGDVRLCALKKIKDSGFLEHIAEHDRSAELRWYATDHIINHELRTRLAQTDPDMHVRLCAMRGILDENVLCSIAKTAAEVNESSEAVYWMHNTELLLDAAKNARHVVIRERALDKILSFFRGGDDPVLNGIVMEAIVEKQKLYYDMLGEPKYVRQVIGYMTDADCLKSIALSRDLGNPLREAAMMKITDPQTLAALAANQSEEYCIRERAVDQLTDQDTLKTLSDGPDMIIRGRAIRKLNDVDALLRIARSDRPVHDLSQAWQRLLKIVTDDMTMLEMAKFFPDDMFTFNFADLIQSQTVLARIATCGDLSREKRLCAYRKLAGTEALSAEELAELEQLRETYERETQESQ